MNCFTVDICSLFKYKLCKETIIKKANAISRNISLFPATGSKPHLTRIPGNKGVALGVDLFS